MVYDAIVARIDWSARTPWLRLFNALNDEQRAVVALGQVHEHAAFNGLQPTVQVHGRKVMQMAADGAAALGQPQIEAMLLAAMRGTRSWPELEDEWDRTADFEIEDFIEAHADTSSSTSDSAELLLGTMGGAACSAWTSISAVCRLE